MENTQVQVDPTTCPKCGATGENPCLTPSGGKAKQWHKDRPVLLGLAPEIEQAAAELADPKLAEAAKAKARREKKITAKRGKLPELQEIHRGEQIVNPAKAADRKARKAAKRERQHKARSAEWAKARGAELARARAKAARKRLRDPEIAARAQRRVERREAGIAARAKAAS